MGGAGPGGLPSSAPFVTDPTPVKHSITGIQRRLFPKHTPTGMWVAEVWLEWDICTGSTMYRQRFVHRDEALTAVRRAAQKLDWLLPDQDFGIKYGVRESVEADTGNEIWCAVMPGSPDYCGEHWQAHPLNQKCNSA